MSTGAWAALGVVLTVCGTVIVALLNQRSSRESTKVTEAAALVHGQNEFMDRQRQVLLDCQAREEVLQQRLDKAVDERDAAEDRLAACEHHNAQLREDMRSLQAIVVTQINQEAGRFPPPPTNNQEA